MSTSTIKYGVKLLIHPHFNSSHTLLAMWLHIHVSKRALMNSFSIRGTHYRPKRVPCSYSSLKNIPDSRMLDEKNPFSIEIAAFEAQ